MIYDGRIEIPMDLPIWYHITYYNIIKYNIAHTHTYIHTLYIYIYMRTQVV